MIVFIGILSIGASPHFFQFRVTLFFRPVGGFFYSIQRLGRRLSFFFLYNNVHTDPFEGT